MVTGLRRLGLGASLGATLSVAFGTSRLFGTQRSAARAVEADRNGDVSLGELEGGRDAPQILPEPLPLPRPRLRPVVAGARAVLGAARRALGPGRRRSPLGRGAPRRRPRRPRRPRHAGEEPAWRRRSPRRRRRRRPGRRQRVRRDRGPARLTGRPGAMETVELEDGLWRWTGLARGVAAGGRLRPRRDRRRRLPDRPADPAGGSRRVPGCARPRRRARRRARPRPGDDLLPRA